MPAYPIDVMLYLVEKPFPYYLVITIILSVLFELLYTTTGINAFSISLITNFCLINILLLLLTFTILRISLCNQIKNDIVSDKIIYGSTFAEIFIVLLIILLGLMIVGRYLAYVFMSMLI